MTAHDPVSSQEPLRLSCQSRPAGALLVDAQHLWVHPLALVRVARLRLALGNHRILPRLERCQYPAKVLAQGLDELHQVGMRSQVLCLVELTGLVKVIPKLYP